MHKTAMIILKNVSVFNPESLGIKDLLVAGTRVIAVEESIDPGTMEVEVIDGTGKMVIPGLIDGHVHIAGAGGEGGPATRTPELRLEELIAGGITSVVGCLGTDGFTRDLKSVLMKAKALRTEGVSAWMYTGAYPVPPPTLTGEIGKDIALIDEVIGAGEIALSDHRSSHPTVHELIKLASHVRVGGMLGGKAGIVNIHMGDACHPFRLLYEAVEMSELNYKQFLPTHTNRNHSIFEEAKAYGQKGWIDLTTSSYPYYRDIEIKPSRAMVDLLKAGVPDSHVTMTSDGNGSLPHFNKHGELERLETGAPESLFTELRDAILREKVPPETALKTVTSNPATILKLPRKGRIKPGNDADLVMVDKDYQPELVLAMGKTMMKEGRIMVKSTYSS